MRKIIGISLYFVGIGIWIIVLCWAIFWSLPAVVLAFIAGYLTHVRPWPGLKELGVWEYLRNNVFRFRVEGPLDKHREKHKRIIWAIYPHGHFSLSAVFYWALNPKFANARAAVHSALFYLPVVGTLVRWIDAVGVTEREMKDVLNADGEIYMCPGGVADICNEGNKIKKRAGFLRIARECNAVVVPVWCPNERSYYDHYLPFGHRFSNILGFPVPMIVWGKWWMPCLPKQVEESPILVGRVIHPNEKDDAFWKEMERLQNC